MAAGSSALQIWGENGHGFHDEPQRGALGRQQIWGTGARFRRRGTVYYAEVFSFNLQAHTITRLQIHGLQFRQGDPG